MSPFDETPKERRTYTPEQLDKLPVKFGKHKGKTPEVIAELEPKYLIWLYENTTHPARPVICSEALYRECGGKFKSKFEQDEAKRKQEAKRPNSYRPPVNSFDDFDDDIPF